MAVQEMEERQQTMRETLADILGDHAELDPHVFDIMQGLVGPRQGQIPELTRREVDRYKTEGPSQFLRGRRVRGIDSPRLSRANGEQLFSPHPSRHTTPRVLRLWWMREGYSDDDSDSPRIRDAPVDDDDISSRIRDGFNDDNDDSSSNVPQL